MITDKISTHYIYPDIVTPNMLHSNSSYEYTFKLVSMTLNVAKVIDLQKQYAIELNLY